ncbi:hypothetical protein GCM10018952_01070 [Streptosporangium vulgare]
MARIEAASPWPRVVSPVWNQLKQLDELFALLVCGRTRVNPDWSAYLRQPELAK